MASKHLSNVLEAAGEWFELQVGSTYSSGTHYDEQVLAAETEFSAIGKASMEFRVAVAKLKTFEEQALQLIAGTPLPGKTRGCQPQAGHGCNRCVFQKCQH